MALADLYKRPEGIECEHWTGVKPGSKKCKYYLEGGPCELPMMFMCVEWMHANYGYRDGLKAREAQDLIALEELTAKLRAARPKTTGPAPEAPGPSKLQAALAKLNQLGPATPATPPAKPAPPARSKTALEEALAKLERLK